MRKVVDTDICDWLNIEIKILSIVSLRHQEMFWMASAAIYNHIFPPHSYYPSPCISVTFYTVVIWFSPKIAYSSRCQKENHCREMALSEWWFEFTNNLRRVMLSMIVPIRCINMELAEGSFYFAGFNRSLPTRGIAWNPHANKSFMVKYHGTGYRYSLGLFFPLDK
jgi:hypothetical protein